MNTQPLQRRAVSVLFNAACVSTLHLLCQTSTLLAREAPNQQVLIQSHFVETSGAGSRELGFKWEVSAGVTLQTNRISFDYKPSPSDFGNSFPKSGGSKEIAAPGDPYQDYKNGRIFFLDSFAQEHGFAKFSGGMVRDTNDVRINGATLDLESVRFHSARTFGEGGVSTHNEDTLTAMPFIQLGYNFKRCPEGAVGIFGQYALGNIDESSGWMNGPLGGEKYSFKYPVFDSNRVIFDPSYFNSQGAAPAIPAPHRMVRDIYTRSSADLNVWQHRLTLGVQASKPPLPWLNLTVAAGPTLTILDYDYRSTSELWIGNWKAATHEVTDSDTKVRLGFMWAGGVRLNFGTQRNWFVDGQLRIDYTDPVKIGNGSSNAEVGNWGYGGSFSAGYQF